MIGMLLVEKPGPLKFVERLREERKFASVAELQDRLRVDERIARAVLNG